MGAFPGTQVHTADNAVPPLDDHHADLDAGLTGFHPGIDLIRDGLRLISLDQLTTEQTHTLIGTLAGDSDGTDVVGLIAATIRRLANADTNPCLRALPADRINDLRRIGHDVATDIDTSLPRDLVAEISARIEGM